MTNKKQKNNSRITIEKIEAAIDQGSEEAARILMKHIVRELLHGRPLLKRHSFRLALGLGLIVDDHKCMEMLSFKKSTKRMLKKKYPEKYASPSSKRGPKPKTFDEDLQVFYEVQIARGNTGILKDSANKKGAFSQAGEKLNLSAKAIEQRYYKAKVRIEKVLLADEEARSRVLRYKEISTLLPDMKIDFTSS